jgi:hypothetical protein
VTVNLAAILALPHSVSRKMVLIALCHSADVHGKARISHVALAKLTGHGKLTVANAVRWLHDNGLIRKNPLRGSHSPDCYAISRRFLDSATCENPEPES